jgi:copper(I)-binding protein
MRSKYLVIPQTVTAILAICWASIAAAHIEVSDMYVRGLPPGQPNTAAFMTVLNDTTDEMTLVGVESSAAKAAEMHRHSHANGVMRMRQVSAIDLQSGEQFIFSPGGYHIMLIGLHKPLRHGDSIDLQLNFASGAKMALTVPVRSVLKEND